MACLIIRKDGKELLRHTLHKKLTTLGRASRCDIVLGDPDVSSLHANVLCGTDGCYRLMDPGSTNGTFVQGKRIQEYAFKDGDDFQIGRFRITFLQEDALDKTAAALLNQDFIGKSQALLSEIKGAQLTQVLEKTQDIEAGRALKKSLENLDHSLLSAQCAQEQLRTLLQMAEDINSAKGFDSVLTAILDSALVATGMERGTIILYDEAKQLAPAVIVGLEKEDIRDGGSVISWSVVNKAIAEVEPILLSDIDEAGELKNAQSVVAQNIKATACLPLKSRMGKLMGALYMDSRLSAVNKANLSPDFLRMFGIFAATAIQTRQMAQREKEIGEELAAAREREKFLNQVKLLERENIRLVKQAGSARFIGLLGTSEPMQRLFSFIEKVAPTDVSVLLTGETGTGKGVVAKAIHDLSDRRDKEFVIIDCASIPGELLESELFGYEKGAFTGAVQQKKGRIELAEGGTLFLDEIGDMPFHLQAKMLRFLQGKSLERVGGNKTLVINARVLAATNKDLKAEVAEKRFREDLYYRLCGVTLQVPSLRDRGEDAYVLANVFLNEVKAQNNLQIKGFTPETKNAILHYPWQGNVRQLKNVIQRAAILCNDEYIKAEDLGLEPVANVEGATLKEARAEADKKLIKQQLLFHKGNLSKTARALDVDRGTLRELMKKYGIEETDPTPI
jgi:transcriptional regulator with GAF, ATPase, and Fis domain